jgi:hypothetical protein
MTWLWLYLGAGLVYCLGVLIWNRTRRKSAISLALENINRPMKWSDQLLERFIAPLLGVTLFVLGWPLVIWYMYKGKRDEEREAQRKKDALFRVLPHDLRSPTTIEDVESANYVSDPLGAIPDLPFGHLNAVWADFLARRPADAELWHFACDWQSEWRTVFKRQGYVWVSGEKLNPWMLTQDDAEEDDNE